jgi:hypothetical protein
MRAAIAGLEKLYDRFAEERKEIEKPFLDEYHVPYDKHWKESHKEKDWDFGYLRQLEKEMNAVNIRAADALISVHIENYNLMKAEATRVWETMLPFARATAEPMGNTAYLYERCSKYPLDVIRYAAVLPIQPFWENADPSEETQTAQMMAFAERQIAEEKAAEEELKAKIKAEAEALLKGFTGSVEIGPVEIKLSTNRIEVEYVAIIAARTAFDWKSKQMDMGLGLGYQTKIGVTKLGGVGASVKGYANVALDMREGTVTDIYLSSEAKASVGGFEGGAQYRISTYTKGGGWGLSDPGLSTAAKQKFGRFGVEHESEILSGD